ncbi:MAG: hypothetical protein E5X66_15625 [Mesorhizobium sp.]|nr:MAG: hypothetical protein E5X66_15625 [Mesorhizobium sp.]
MDLMIRLPGSHIYIDTSFLMWMFKIGPESREEFSAWLKQVCGDRISVPTWSTHELYRHHVEKRLPTDVEEHIKKLNGLVGESFSMFWTLFDEPLGGAPSVGHQRDQARDALRSVRTLTDRAAAWSANYDRNAREVIDFANRHALKGGALFDQFTSLEGLSAARYTGRVPPGFQDKLKKEKVTGTDDGSEAVVGSNRWGDLIFWQEVLEHARANRVRNVIILTKDVKNDWRMAGTLPVRAADESNGPGVQPPHPMLSFEAARTAGVQELVLLDQGRLSEVMKVASPERTAKFVTTARPPALPPPKTDAEIRSEAIERELQERAKINAGIARASNLRFMDPDGMTVSKAILLKAVYETREGVDVDAQFSAFEESIRHALASGQIVDIVNAEAVAALRGKGLVGFARRLVSLSGDDQQRVAAANDLAEALKGLPPVTATFLYMGLMAGTYLDHRNQFLASPRPAVAQKLFALQHLPIASLPIQDVATRASKASHVPLYLPSVDRPPIAVEFKIDTDLDRENALRSLWIGDQDLLIDVQSDAALQLSRRIGDVPLTPALVLDHVADLYVLPRGQLAAAGNIIAAYSFDEHIGFRAPQDVRREISQGEANG